MYFINSILDKIEHTSFHFKNDSITVTININMYTGICFEDEKRLEKADRALTQAKKEKKSYVIYNEDKNNTNVHLNNIKMISKITNALKNDNIIVFYQAIVNENKQIKKYEALVRMRDENDIISPFHFLDISKRTRHYNSITKVVIEKTFEKFKNEDKRFSINLTADDIINEDTVNLINKKLSECKDPTQVVFELVESDDLSELSEIEEFITNIKKIGAKIAIDDFGTGYSNFSYMIRIKPDFLKIDGSLITNINSDENAYKIVQTIVSFCKKLNIKTIAEFVHSEEIFEICKNLGIDEFQGYYFSEPKEEL
jgi:EAL domain-containing protein (putative c-di-GMP-specific phosphodiesterase class I)